MTGTLAIVPKWRKSYGVWPTRKIRGWCLEGMIEYGVFNEPKALPEIIKHLYIDREDKKEERQVLEGVLEELVKEGKLAFNEGAYLKSN